MRRARVILICDMCLQDLEVEEPATRLIVLGENGQVRALDICDTHDGDLRPTQLESTAKTYGTLLKSYITSKGRLATVSIGHTPHEKGSRQRRRESHEPGGPWSGEASGPATCLVELDDGRPCAQTCRNVIGLKKHQWMRHGVTVKRD